MGSAIGFDGVWSEFICLVLSSMSKFARTKRRGYTGNARGLRMDGYVRHTHECEVDKGHDNEVGADV